MHDFSHLFQIVNHGPVLAMDLAHGGRVHLQCELPGDGVLPHHGQDLDFRWIRGRKLGGRELEVFGEKAEAVGAGFGGTHPDVGVRSIFDAACAHEVFIGFGEDVVHGVSTHEGSSAKRHLELFAGAVIVAESLGTTLGDGDCKKRGDFWRVEVIEGGINVPAVEASMCEIVGFWDGMLVKLSVVGMHELEVLQAFIFGDEAVADDLNFLLVRHGLQIRVQDAFLSIYGFAVPVAVGCRVKLMGQFVLGFWRAAGLVLDDDYMGLVECFTNEGEVIICNRVSTELQRILFRWYLRRRLPFHGVLPFFSQFNHSTKCVLGLDLPFRCSTSRFSILAPKLMSDEGIEIDSMDMGRDATVMVEDE